MSLQKPVLADVMGTDQKYAAKPKAVSAKQLIPVAKLSKIQLARVQANKQLIVYPTTRPGIIRAVSQEDGEHATLDASRLSSIEFLQLVEIGETESMVVAADRQKILVWLVDYTMLDEDSLNNAALESTVDDGAQLTAVTGVPGKRHLVVCWEQGDQAFCGHCNVFSGAITPAMKLEQGAGRAVAPLAEYTDIAVVTDGLGLESIKGGQVAEPNNLNYDAFTAGGSVLDLSYNTQLERLVVTTENNVTILDENMATLAGLRLAAEARQVAYFEGKDTHAVITLDTKNRVNVVVHTRDSFTGVASFKFDGTVHAVCASDDLDEGATGSAFDLYVLHTKGLGYLSVKTKDVQIGLVPATQEELEGAEAEADEADDESDASRVPTGTQTPDMDSSAVLLKRDDKCVPAAASPAVTSAYQSAAASPLHSGTPEPTVGHRKRKDDGPEPAAMAKPEPVSDKKAARPEPESAKEAKPEPESDKRAKAAAKTRSKPETASKPDALLAESGPSDARRKPGHGDSTTDMAESYSRDAFKERTYNLNALLESNQFVPRHEYDALRAQVAELRTAHRVEIKRLEQRIDKLYERLNKVQQRTTSATKQDKARARDSQRSSVEPEPESASEPVPEPVPEPEAESEAPQPETQAEPEPDTKDASQPTGQIGQDANREPSPELVPAAASSKKTKRQRTKRDGTPTPTSTPRQDSTTNAASFTTADFERELIRMTKMEKTELQPVVSDFVRKCHIQDLGLQKNSYHDQLLLMSAMACVALGADSAFIDSVNSFLEQVVSLVNPRLPEFQRDPKFFVSVINRAKSHLRSTGASNISGVISRLQNLIATVY